MSANLVIVESPAKARTIERYLGPGYTVLASFGHVRDLPRSNFAVELDGDGACHLVYEVPEKSRKHVAALKKAAKKASTVWLAPDLDREGEAIAWHVAQVLGLDPKVTKRVTFDEITEPAIRAAFESPRTLDTALVDAQQARRAVDRIVGYRLSPVLWRTVSSGISAGRVQSVALRLIIDREEEIRAFVPETYFDFPSLFARDGVADVTARLALVDGARLATPKDLDGASDAKADALLIVRTEDEAEAIAARARGLDYVVREVRRTEARRQPKPPFKTSTLQGEGSRLGFSARQTMAIAQQLYEGVSLGGEPTGLITYMRTDSLNLSAQSLTEIGAFVRTTYGERYTIAEPRRFATTSKGAQEAHEAIRPTSVQRTPESVRRHLTNEQARLYEVIWQRTVATQMAPAVFDRVSVDVAGGDAAGELVFRVSGQVERFDGYLRAYREARDEDDTDDDAEARLPDLAEGERLTLASITPERHETSPPPRFSERTLVEVLEELGIGRPSTYASIISTLEQRDYVIKESRRFFPTALGEVVVAFLKVHFPEIVDVNFTARMEETLDEIASGEAVWGRTVTAFLDEVDEWVRERKPERPRLPLRVPTDCHLCGAPMERVFSGKSKSWFASCSRWPDCDGTLPLEADGTVGEPEAEAEPDERVRCPKCDQPMLLRSGRYGRFYSCVDYPGCKGIRGLQQRLMYRDEDGEVHPFRSPTDPNVFMELRTSRYGKPFVGSTGYPDDVFAVWSLPLASPCPECGAPLRQPPRNRREPIAVCAHPVLQHVFALEDFELPTVATWTVVDGVAPFDPELGGEPIAVEEPPMPIVMTLIGTQAPPAKRPGRGRFAAKDGESAAEGDGGTEGAESTTGRARAGGRAAKEAPAKKASSRKVPAKKASAKKATAKKASAKKASAKKASAKKATAKRTTARTGGGVGGTGRQPAARKAAARKTAATTKDGRGGSRAGASATGA